MSTSEPAWAWLGLLKWSLAYSDGTSPSSESMAPMSAEDKSFLEAVMRDGIIDENERMKFVLKNVTEALEYWKSVSEIKSLAKTNEEQQKAASQPDPIEIEELLLELRDIVEQIDYARAFAAMKGLVFLLGCAQERDAVPQPIRQACLGVLATMCQNNPPVQLELLSLGSIKILSELFMKEEQDGVENAAEMQAKIVQAMSASVRSHEVAEEVFCQIDLGRHVLDLAVRSSNDKLHKRGLFFLRAVVTSDTSTPERVRMFSGTIAHVADNCVDDKRESNAELREVALALLSQILEQKKSVNTILSRKDALVSLGVRRIAELRRLEGEERDFAGVELEHWESLLTQLARAQPDSEDAITGTSEATLMIEDRQPDDTETIPQ